MNLKSSNLGLWLLLFSVLILNPVLSQGRYEPQIYDQKNPDGTVSLIFSSPFCTENTVTLNVRMINMTSSHPLPFTFDTIGYPSLEILQLKPLNPFLPYAYDYTFTSRFGRRRAFHDPKTIYLLPYSERERYRVIQGYFGAFSHQKGTENQYAIDFEMPIGTTVRAAREGNVIAVRQDSNLAGPSPEFKGKENYIVIMHDDGTCAEYLHLQRGGALVHVGQRVRAGQPIGLSGNTGQTSTPHLHFAVFRNIDGTSRQTFPTIFRIRGRYVGQLIPGQKY